MNNKQNCRIGWMTYKGKDTKFLLIEKGEMLLMKYTEKSGKIAQMYVPSTERTTIRFLYKRFPHHPLLRTLMTMPRVETVILWDGRTNKD